MIFSFFALMLPVLASALVTPSPNMKTLRLHHRRLIQLQNLKWRKLDQMNPSNYSRMCKHPSAYNPNQVVTVDFSSGFSGPCDDLFPTSGQFVNFPWYKAECGSFVTDEQRDILMKAKECCSDGITACESHTPEFNSDACHGMENSVQEAQTQNDIFKIDNLECRKCIMSDNNNGCGLRHDMMNGDGHDENKHDHKHEDHPCGLGTVWDPAKQMCHLSFDDFVQKCQTDPANPMCGNHATSTDCSTDEYPRGSCGFHGWGEERDGRKCNDNRVPYGKDDPALHKIADNEFECCQTHRNCHYVMEERHLHCPDGTERRPEHDWHMPWGQDWDKSPDELYGECCQAPSCDTWHGDCPHGTAKNPWWRPGTKLDSETCCHANCYSSMTAKGFDCKPEDGRLRDIHDFHQPANLEGAFDTYDDMKSECCQQNCWSVMSTKGLTCDVGKEPRGMTDYHQPPDGWDQPAAVLADECCYEEEQNCHMVMNKRQLQCPSGTEMRSEHDWHRPWGNDWHKPDSELQAECCRGPSCSDYHGTCPAGQNKMDWAHYSASSSEDEKQNECCASNCHSTMAAKGLSCHVGHVRSEWDWHQPFGGDWNRDDTEIKRECCVQNCYGVMDKKKLACDVGDPRGPDDYHQPFGDDWNRDDTEIKRECCVQNCYGVMNERQLTCDIGQARHQHDNHMPFGSDWQSPSDDDMKRECCSHNCFSVFKEKGLSCDSGRLRGKDDYHMPWGNDWNRDTTELQDECCQKNCNMVMSEKEVTCPAGSEPRDKEDYHQPSREWEHLTSSDMIAEECCIGPMCATWGGSCPDEKTLALYHRPKTLSDSECCYHNCHSVMGNKQLSCDNGTTLRDINDFHMPWGLDWEKPATAIKDECCIRTCANEMDKHMGCASITLNKWRIEIDSFPNFDGIDKETTVSQPHSLNLSEGSMTDSKQEGTASFVIEVLAATNMVFEGSKDLWVGTTQIPATAIVAVVNEGRATMVARDAADGHQPKNGWDNISEEEMARECCRVEEPAIGCIRSDCPDFDLTKWEKDPDWISHTRSPQWGLNSSYVLETIQMNSEWKAGITCSCKMCHQLLVAMWPAGNETCSVL